MKNDSRSHLIKRSSIISAIGNTFLAVLKVVVGLASHSLL